MPRYAVSAWRISSCSKTGSGSYNIKTQNNVKRCATESSFNWVYWNGSATVKLKNIIRLMIKHRFQTPPW